MALPKGPTGKILKREIEVPEQVEASTGRAPGPPVDSRRQLACRRECPRGTASHVGDFGAGAAGGSRRGDERLRRRLLRAGDLARQGCPQRHPDLHRLDARGLHRPLEPARAPGRHAQPLDALGQDSLAFKLSVPEAMPTGLGPPRPAHRRALVPVPQLRPDQGTAARPGLDTDPRPPADSDRGARRGRRRDRLLHRQPVPGRPALRQLPPHALDFVRPELPPGRLPLPQQALQAPCRAARSSATCFPS